MRKLFVAFLLVIGSWSLAVAAPREVPLRAGAISRNATPIARAAVIGRTATAPTVSARSATTSSGRTAAAPTVSARNATTSVSARRTSPQSPVPSPRKARSAVAARAAIDETSAAVAETRTGAEYEQCKNAYFTCMDQFCKLKSDDFRRCSCSDRVYDLENTKSLLGDANTQLTQFTQNLDTVGMTAAQAAAMKTASDGENALTGDNSASAAILQAIMNSIRGEDANVNNSKLSGLNSINLSFDTANAFGMSDSGQVVASYNGKNLYTAVYPQCRNMVRADCNDASLQRAVNAYLMAIESDCNTVQTVLDDSKKKMTAAVREGGAMLDLARVENRQKHNSESMTACLNNVEAAVLSPEVCGPGYRKCLDNGQFIDVSTGAPIAGVVNFFELENLLTFDYALDAADQNLSRNSNNRRFVQNFEDRVKKFAEPALDKCREDADTVWADYLDKAMLDIYYAQKSKVAEIKQGCFDFVSSCYINGDKSISAAMAELVGEALVMTAPDKIALSGAMCTQYVDSCSNMFDGDIIAKYMQERETHDTLTACRAVAQQCFTKFGGARYENFHYPHSGLFSPGNAIEWFSLYDRTADEESENTYASECAKQLAAIPACSDKDMIEKTFGGMDMFAPNNDYKAPLYGILENPLKYGMLDSLNKDIISRKIRPTGVATEIYFQIIDNLISQCNNQYGRFIEMQFLENDDRILLRNPEKPCHTKNPEQHYTDYDEGDNPSYVPGLKLVINGYFPNTSEENICPKGYENVVDVLSWGECNCWENGARRSKNGEAESCETVYKDIDGKFEPATTMSDYGQVCANEWDLNNGLCTPPAKTNDVSGKDIKGATNLIPKGMK